MSEAVPFVAPVDRAALVVAMGLEAAPLVAALDAEPVAPPGWAACLPVRVFRAPRRDSRPEVWIGVNGVDPVSGVDAIGTTAAALTTNVVLQPDDGHRPDLVVSVGTAGGWQRAGAAVGDVYVAWPKIVCHDRRIPLAGFEALGTADLPVADLRGRGGCRRPPRHRDDGDSLDESPTDRVRIEASGAEVKEMEAAAVAWVAALHGVPMTAVKAITDLVDHEIGTPAQFVENLGVATESLVRATTALLDVLGSRAGDRRAIPRRAPARPGPRARSRAGGPRPRGQVYTAEATPEVLAAVQRHLEAAAAELAGLPARRRWYELDDDDPRHVRIAARQRSTFSGPRNRLRRPCGSVRWTTTSTTGCWSAAYGSTCCVKAPGAVHGGVLAGLFDELMGGALRLGGALAGVTGRLTVRYRRPTPSGKTSSSEPGSTTSAPGGWWCGRSARPLMGWSPPRPRRCSCAGAGRVDDHRRGPPAARRPESADDHVPVHRQRGPLRDGFGDAAGPVG
ncbi:MAG: hotdog domain-containing protein [Acidimicrobiales bacterium]